MPGCVGPGGLHGPVTVEGVAVVVGQGNVKCRYALLSCGKGVTRGIHKVSLWLAH